MSRIDSEQRTLRNGLDTYLTANGWGNDLGFSEGWSLVDIEKPLVNVYVLDNGKEQLELGSQFSTHKLFRRMCQIDVYMESESRVRSICEDVMEYLDAVSGTINDTLTTSGIGYLSFPNSDSIQAIFLPPVLGDPEILRWRGSVRGQFEAYYPNGGNPL